MPIVSLSYWESDVYWRQNNKHFAELAPQNGGKQLIWRNYVTVILCMLMIALCLVCMVDVCCSGESCKGSRVQSQVCSGRMFSSTVESHAPFTRYNLLSNRVVSCIQTFKRLSNRVCQTGCTTRFDNRLNEQWLFVQHGCQTRLTTGLTTGWAPCGLRGSK